MCAETATKPSTDGKAPTTMAAKGKRLEITAPNFQTMQVEVTNSSPLMIHRFAKKADIEATQREGSRKTRGKKDKPPRDFEKDFEEAKYLAVDGGWEGFNAASIRNAMIRACSTVGAVMTHAKLAIFVEADGYDNDGIPLVRIQGKSVMDIRPARNKDNSMDLRSRPRYDKWHATLRLRYDADMMSAEDVGNLLMRAGMQVGIGELRPSSPLSAGMGYGLFDVTGE